MQTLLPGIYGSDLGFFQVATPASAKSIATIIGQAIPKGSLGCLLQVIGADAVYRDDGVAPTSTIGFTIFSGQNPIWISGWQMRAALLIQGAGGTSTLNIGFYGP